MLERNRAANQSFLHVMVAARSDHRASSMLMSFCVTIPQALPPPDAGGRRTTTRRAPWSASDGAGWRPRNPRQSADQVARQRRQAGPRWVGQTSGTLARAAETRATGEVHRATGERQHGEAQARSRPVQGGGRDGAAGRRAAAAKGVFAPPGLAPGRRRGGMALLRHRVSDAGGHQPTLQPSAARASTVAATVASPTRRGCAPLARWWAGWERGQIGFAGAEATEVWPAAEAGVRACARCDAAGVKPRGRRLRGRRGAAVLQVRGRA